VSRDRARRPCPGASSTRCHGWRHVLIDQRIKRVRHLSEDVLYVSGRLVHWTLPGECIGVCSVFLDSPSEGTLPEGFGADAGEIDRLPRTRHSVRLHRADERGTIAPEWAPMLGCPVTQWYATPAPDDESPAIEPPP
jgi:hypothetical protein